MSRSIESDDTSSSDGVGGYFSSMSCGPATVPPRPAASQAWIFPPDLAGNGEGREWRPGRSRRLSIAAEWVPDGRRIPLAALVGLAALAGAVGPVGAGAQQALVLGGGSARGLAHVGVLLELEQLGYEPDMVVGTSMGAVVGALYAAGYSPAEIRDRTLDIAWGEMFDPTATLLGPGRVPRLPLATFSLDLAHRRVSRGLFGDWRINRALVRLLFGANARAAGDFDRLTRRYRAVATDLESGDRVVLESGDLARAARASMAYPGFFAPVRWEGRLLVDGGIADNLPTLEARRLGATTVIAVDVSRPRDDVSQDPLAVAGRALRLMQRNTEADPVPPDILILPEVDGGGIGPAFPDDAAPLIEAGRTAARRDLAPHRVSDGRGERPLPPEPSGFAGLRIEAPDSALAALARDVFASVAPGPYDVVAVLSGVDRLYGTGLFEGVWPRVEAGPGGDEAEPILVVHVETGARLSLAGAAGFDNDRGGRGWAALDRTATVAGRPAVWSAALSTDGLERWGALSARVHASARPAIAWSVGAHVQERSVRSFLDDTRTTLEVLRSGGWVGLELPHILHEHLVTVSGRAEWLDPETAPGWASFGPRVRVAAVPTEALVVGIPLRLEAEARWGTRPYHRVELAASRTMAVSVLQAAALLDLHAVGGDAPPDVVPSLGDDHAVPGLRWGERRGRARVVTGVDLAVPGPLNGFARLRLRTGAVADVPRDWERVGWVGGALIGGIWRTPLGVVEVGYGLATVGDGRFDLSIGRSF